MNLLRPDLVGEEDISEYDNKDSSNDIFSSKSDGENNEDDYSRMSNRLSLQDNGWISPPDSIYSSSSNSSCVTSSAEEYLNPVPVSSSYGTRNHDGHTESEHRDVNNSDAVSVDDELFDKSTPPVLVETSLHSLNLGISEVKFDEPSSSNQDKVDKEIHEETPLPNTTGPASRIPRGKNNICPYFAVDSSRLYVFP